MTEWSSDIISATTTAIAEEVGVHPKHTEDLNKKAKKSSSKRSASTSSSRSTSNMAAPPSDGQVAGLFIRRTRPNMRVTGMFGFSPPYGMLWFYDTRSSKWRSALIPDVVLLFLLHLHGSWSRWRLNVHRHMNFRRTRKMWHALPHNLLRHPQKKNAQGAFVGRCYHAACGAQSKR